MAPLGARTNKGTFDPNSPDWELNPMTDPGHSHTSASVSNTNAGTVTSPSFTTGQALQLNATQAVDLYINVKTAASLAVLLGPTSTPANTIVASETVALGLVTIHVPAGWYVEITGTIADLGIVAVTS